MVELHLSGHPLRSTGGRKESWLQFVHDSAMALGAEANFAFANYPNSIDLWVVFYAVLALTLAVTFWVAARGSAARDDLPDRQERLTIAVLAVTGVFFMACMLGVRANMAFGVLNHRLLAPGSILLTAAALGAIASRGALSSRKVENAVAAIILASVVQSCMYQPHFDTYDDIFPVQLRNVREHYAEVPSGAAVIHASRHLLFLRPDLRVIPARKMHRLQHRLAAEHALRTMPVWSDQGGQLRRIDNR